MAMKGLLAAELADRRGRSPAPSGAFPRKGAWPTADGERQGFSAKACCGRPPRATIVLTGDARWIAVLKWDLDYV